MAIVRLIEMLFKSAKWVTALMAGIVLGLIGLFFLYAFLPYYVGQSEHGDLVESGIFEMLKANRKEFPVSQIADFNWHHVCYAARGVLPPPDVKTKLGINVSRDDWYPWFGDRRFWTVIFALPDQKVEVVRLSTSKAGGHRGYGSFESYCLPREEASFDVTPDNIFGHQLTLVKRQWLAEEKLKQLIISNPKDTTVLATQTFPFDWVTICIIPSGRQQFEVSSSVGAQIEWHSVLYPWIGSSDYYSVLLLDHNGGVKVLRIDTQHYVALNTSNEYGINCSAREVAKFKIQDDPAGRTTLSLTNSSKE